MKGFEGVCSYGWRETDIVKVLSGINEETYTRSDFHCKPVDGFFAYVETEFVGEKYRYFHVIEAKFIGMAVRNNVSGSIKREWRIGALLDETHVELYIVFFINRELGEYAERESYLVIIHIVINGIGTKNVSVCKPPDDASFEVLGKGNAVDKGDKKGEVNLFHNVEF